MLSVIKMSTPWLTNGNWKLLSVLFPFLFSIFSWFCVKWRWSKCNSWWISTSMISGLQCIYCSLNEFVVRSHKVPRYRYFGHFVNGHLICQLTFQKIVLFAFNCLYIFVDDRMIVLFALFLIQLKSEIAFPLVVGCVLDFCFDVPCFSRFRVGIEKNKYFRYSIELWKYP